MWLLGARIRSDQPTLSARARNGHLPTSSPQVSNEVVRATRLFSAVVPGAALAEAVRRGVRLAGSVASGRAPGPWGVVLGGAAQREEPSREPGLVDSKWRVDRRGASRTSERCDEGTANEEATAVHGPAFLEIGRASGPLGTARFRAPRRF